MVQEIMDATLYCVLATITPDGRPQSVPVRFAFDDDFIYFRSSPDSNHCKNMAHAPHVSVTIYDTSQAVKGALYIHSEAIRLDGVQKEQALAIFNERFNFPEDQWGNTAYFSVAIGEIDTEKSIDKMFYFQERSV